jgi:putative membrane protein
VLIGLGTAVGGHRRWRANEDAISGDRPLPRSPALGLLATAVAVVVVAVGVLVGVEVLTR